jgi:hypothetical protein
MAKKLKPLATVLGCAECNRLWLFEALCSETLGFKSDFAAPARNNNFDAASEASASAPTMADYIF